MDTSEIFSSVIIDNDLPEKLVKKFKEDVYIFSGLKTHSQLLEASKQLFTKDNKIKSFETFSKDISKLKKDYNENYLEAEHDYAVGTMEQVERWESFSDSERYYLQYRTASDDRVRDTHAVLHNTTLPKKDNFWNFYTPKNGWRCRCSTVQVLAATNDVSSSSEAIKKGNKATTKIGKGGKNTLEIFRYNPAKEKVVFPPKHPYNKITGANKVKAILKDGL
ncbi:phage minor head protein [Tenacibaculum maritimum]|nr:phage minor head protein [Tenacibaculum maritimum]MDB0611263.1 phage minor head protein [Tenacibaculum maritimum]